jgi:hypothetical protein
MAVTALDNPSRGQPAGVYHGGRDLLAMSLRGEKGSAETKYRAVKRAVAELTEAGAIEHLATGWAGQNAVYRLTLDRAGSAVEPTEMGGPTNPPMGGLMSPPMGGRSGTERGVVETPPRNQEELQEERREEEGVDVRPAVTVARATEPNPEPAVVVEIFPGALQEPPFITAPPGRRLTRAQQTLAEATANREAARRAHRARKEAT